MTTVEEVLSHHGVIGQKWGVRRSRAALARAANARGDSPAESSKKQSSSKGRASDFSTQELQAVINRMQLEKQYRSLTAEAPKVKSPMRAFAEKLVGDITKDQLNRVSRRAADVAVEAALGKTADKLVKGGKKQQGELLGEVVERLKPKDKKKK